MLPVRRGDRLMKLRSERLLAATLQGQILFPLPNRVGQLLLYASQASLESGYGEEDR